MPKRTGWIRQGDLKSRQIFWKNEENTVLIAFVKLSNKMEKHTGIKYRVEAYRTWLLKTGSAKVKSIPNSYRPFTNKTYALMYVQTLITRYS